MLREMQPERLPNEVGTCRYCRCKLYEDAPIVHYPDGDLSHVACEADARRRGDPRSVGG